MDDQKISQAAHTRVPNVVADVILPLLTPAERDCLHYIMRRTYGFSDGEGGRKARDTISLDQFEYGISSGNYLLDLGTQLSRGTIKKALEGLMDKELVEVRFSCLKCYWEQGPEDEYPQSEGGQAPRCPRCGATLARSWAMTDLTPRKVVSLLNQHDKLGRSWNWDIRSKRFRWEDAVAEEKRTKSQADLREEALRLRNLIWYPKLVDEAVDLAEGQLKSGRKISLARRINNFYKPVYELQEAFPIPPLIKYSLEQTIAGPALKQPDTHRWYRYLGKVIENSQPKFQGENIRQGTNAAVEEENSIRSREMAVRELLKRAAEHNDRQEAEPARALLADILAQTKVLAEMFDGDEAKADASLREAYKQGSSDFAGIRPAAHNMIDFYPEWSWPDNIQI